MGSVFDALQTLGPVFVKFGQMLSTRRDLLPPDIAGPLAELQDRVKPFSGEVARSIVESELGCSVDDVFSEFSSDVMASASVAQVHAARLKSGEEVIAKVIRPGIEKVIEEDLRLMTTIARFIERNFVDGKRLKLVQVVSDYRMTILDELDLMREAANTALIRRNFADSTICYVPEIYWDYTRRNVMVEERVYGVPISRIDIFKEKKVNMEKLSERGWRYSLLKYSTIAFFMQTCIQAMSLLIFRTLKIRYIRRLISELLVRLTQSHRHISHKIYSRSWNVITVLLQNFT